MSAMDPAGLPTLPRRHRDRLHSHRADAAACHSKAHQLRLMPFLFVSTRRLAMKSPLSHFYDPPMSASYGVDGALISMTR